MRFILALSLSFSITLAQNNNPPGNNSTATTPASPALQTVTVGKDSTNKFDPDSLTVSAGSKVVFEFYPGHHSVVQGTFNKPCSPLSNVAFFSGYVDINNGSASQTFTISVDNIDPIWFYSGSASQCEEGMVGVINSSQNKTLAMYRLGALNATQTTLPAPNHAQGGVLASPSNGTTSATAKGGAGIGTVSMFGLVSGLAVSLSILIS